MNIKQPKDGEYIGLVIQSLGCRRFRVKCSDGNVRVCNIPNRKLPYIRDDYVVLVESWTIQSDTKGKIIWVYPKSQAEQLRRLL